jgi:copper chaperone CopZ
MGKINIKAIGIGIKAGIISSLCCILPLILVIFGLVSIGTALRIVQFKPYFIGLSIVFLVVSLVLFLRKNKSCCITDKRFFVGTAIITHLLIFILLLYVFVPIIAPSVYTEVSINAFAVNSPENHKLTLKIDGMTCSGCAYGIQYQLEQLEGVIKAEVSFSKRNGEIIYNSNKISAERIINSEVFSNLYSAEIIKDELIGE